MHSQLYNDALKLLDDERNALRQGQLSKVAELVGQKQRIVEDLESIRLSAKEARALCDRATENAKLMDAALQGIREAKARLTALRTVRNGLDIYNADGGKETVRTGKSALERKA